MPFASDCSVTNFNPGKWKIKKKKSFAVVIGEWELLILPH